MIIYKITNNVTGKIYIGQTRRELQHRWSQHLTRAFNEEADTHLYNSMRKHGKESFAIEEIDSSATTLEELNNLERYYIDKYNSVRDGYNILPGGETNPMDVDEVRERHLERVRDYDVRSRISKSMKEYRRNNEVSESTRAKLGEKSRKAHREGRMPKSVMTKETIALSTEAKKKPVTIKYNETTKEFDSIKESCQWVLEEVFDNKFTLRSVQGMATRSRKTKSPVNGVTWNYQ